MGFWKTLGIVVGIFALVVLAIYLFQLAWNLTIGFWWPKFSLTIWQAWAALFVGATFSSFLHAPLSMKFNR